VSILEYSRIFFCFFFSSRRRHTRFSRDWSSDVCSSDLTSRCAEEKATWPSRAVAQVKHQRTGHVERHESRAALEVRPVPVILRLLKARADKGSPISAGMSHERLPRFSPQFDIEKSTRTHCLRCLRQQPRRCRLFHHNAIKSGFALMFPIERFD